MNVEHTTIRNEKLFCINCGGEYAVNLPIDIDHLTLKITAFNSLHDDCKPTWKEPGPDLNESIKQRMLQWLGSGERGMSSNTMFQILSGQNIGAKIAYPYDPDDFKRCYKLLEFIPEWKKELHKLSEVSKQWKNLIANWDKLTEMFEENGRTDWKEHKRIGMYDFMRTLTEV